MKVGLIALYDLNSFSIRTLHSVLTKENIDVDSLFFKCENPNNTMDKPKEEEIESLINFIKEKDYNIIGLSVRSSIFSLAKEISIKIRKLENAPKIVWGGVQATLNPDECIPYADFVVVGEGEKTVVELAKNKNPLWIKNIYFKKNKEIIKNKSGYVEENLDLIPFPDFLNKNKYFLNNGPVVILNTPKYKTRYSIMTSRGCPFSCTYCCNNALRKIYHGRYLRRRSVDNVIEELIKAKKDFPNLMSISFLDDVFSFDKIWLKEFSIKYKKLINLPFYCYTHADMCDEEIINYLKYAGLSETTMGVQSFSDRIKNYYGRHEKNEQILKSAQILKNNNINFSFDIIMDNPIENEEDLAVNLKWLIKIPAPYKLHTHTLTYFPNTKLTQDFVNKGVIKKKDVEDRLEKGWERWTPVLDLKRNKLNLFYDCLYFLAKSKFRSKWLIKELQKNNYFRKNPEKLASLIRPFSTDFLSLNWNSSFDRIKFLVSQGWMALMHGNFKFLFIKIKQMIEDRDVIDV